MKKFFKEFKAFISRGNVFDLAVGMIIATAFNKIVSSLVNDLIMPLITWATGAASLADLSVVLRVAEDGTKLTWKYGNFIQTIIDFLIIAFSVFVMVKIVTASRKKLEEMGDNIIKQSSKEYRAERKLIKAKAKQEKRKFKLVWAEYLEEKKKNEEAKAKAEAEEKARIEAEHKKNNPTQEELLKQIVVLLQQNNDKQNG
ncbi:MAG: large conductance mechanosensitive channel protein MscL [Clostridia bacterium]|nr:large conductance mechanosensitive channel protein MscL [Clostridia bacterium]